MELLSINSRADLDALTGTPEHGAFMALLAGTLWRLEKDDTAQAWVAVEDNSTITRFGFTRADFPDAQPPAPPVYTPTPTAPPKQFTSLEFLDLFTEAEQLSIVQAGMANAAVKLWYDRALAAQYITLADPRTEGGLQSLVQGGLLTAERKAAIVGAMA